MQVALSTIGRFHTFDLARQLHKRNSLGMIFSGYPTFKLKNEGLPREKVKSFPWLHGPYIYLDLPSERVKRFLSWQDRSWFDRFVAANLPECDLFHALSGSALRSGKKATSRGAKYVCDRGSSHIRFQDQILREEYEHQGLSFSGVDPRVIEQEEAEYALADGITVPSHFARTTFLKKGISAAKVHVVPYGVDLTRYKPVGRPASGEFRVLFAGSISVRKGIRYLLEAYDRLQHPAKKLIFMGGVDAALEPFLQKIRERKDVQFTGHVPREEVVKIMSQSHVLVLPSLEEGLALVQAQAMACGCPIIATTNSGAEDLFEHGVEGFVVPIREPDAIAGYLQRLADDPELQEGMRQRALSRVQSVAGWDQYGERAVQTFQAILHPKAVSV